MKTRWTMARAGLALLAGVGAFAVGCAGGGSRAGEVRIAVTDNGFEPAVAMAPRSRPVTLVITRRSDRTCATEAVFASLGKRLDLPLGRPARLDLPAGVSDTLRFACGMDMIKGMIVAR